MNKIKIKHFIVTYNNEKRLNLSLDSLFDSCNNLDNLDIFIINNHSNINIYDKFKYKVKVLNNQTRPDFSTGHLSRNWNQAIINGFKDINNPDCDILITSQDDTIFEKNYLEKSIELSKSFDFISYGTGDQFLIYNIRGIENIGLWDERFCNIGYQEADYFLRAIRYHRHVSINDEHHHRLYNPNLDMIPIKKTISGFHAKDAAHIESLKYHGYSKLIFTAKWGISDGPWKPRNIKMIENINPRMMSYILYPYFEKDIKTLKKQRYFVE